MKDPRSKYLCPIQIHDVSLTGKYDSAAFHYVKIALKGCQLKGDGLCMDEEKLTDQKLSFVMIKT